MGKPVNRMRAVHPGEVLREEYLAPLSLSVNALAMALGVPATRIHEIVKVPAANPAPQLRKPSIRRVSIGLATALPALRAHSASASTNTPLPLARSPLGR